MKTSKLFYLLQILMLSFWVSNSYAINLGFTFTSVLPDPVQTSSTLTVSATIVNSTDTLVAETSNTIRVIVDNFGIDTSANFSYAGNVTGGWTCTPNTTPVTSVICDKAIALPADNTTTTSLSFDLTTGSLPISIVGFNFRVLDTVLTQDTSSAIDTATVSISLVSGGFPPDLDFVDSATPVSYPVTEGQVAPVVLDFQVTNLGEDTASGASFSIFYDDFLFTYNSGSSTIPTGWNCFGSTSSVDCSTDAGVEVFGASFTDFKIAFDTSGVNGNATSTGSPYTFSATLFATGDINSINDSISTDVVVTVASPDFSVTLVDIDSVSSLTSLDYPEGSLAAQTARFNVKNNGGNAPNGAVVSFSFDDGVFSLANSTTPLGWSCVAITGQVDCTNSNVLTNGAFFDFYVDFSPVQSLTAGSYTPLVTTITDSSSTETNLADNSVSTPVSIITVQVLDIQFDDVVNTPTYLPISFGDLAVQNVPYQIVNNGPDSLLGAEVYFSFDDTKFSLVGSTTSPGWSCLVISMGLYVCDTSSNFPSGATANFDVQFATLSATTSGYYTSAIIADVNPIISGGLKKSTSRPGAKALIGSQILTDVELVVLADPDVVINKSFGNGFVTNTITEAQVGSSVTYKLLADAVDICTGTLCPQVSPGANVQITDVLPAGVSFDSLNVLGSNFNCSQSVGIISCTASSLPITTADDGVEITVLVSGNVGDVITNTATVTADNDVNANNNSSSPGSFTVAAALPTTLSVNKQVVVLGVPVDAVPKGSAFTYRLAIKNTGNSNAINLQLLDEMPVGIQVNGFSGSGWSCTNLSQQYTCNYPGPLVVGGTTFLNFNVIDNSAPDVTQLLNVADVSADNAPSVSDALFTNLTDVSFELTVIQNPNPIEENKPFDFVIEIANTGTQEIIGAEVVNMLPDGFTYSPITKSSTCMINGPEMFCTVDTPIAVGATEIINIGVQAIQLADSNVTYTNVTTVSGGNIMSPTTVNTVTNVNVTGDGSGGYNYNIFLTSDIVDTVETETPYTYTVNLENTGSLDITFMDVAINLPSDLTILSMMTSGFSCTTISLGLDCSADTGFSLAAGMNSDIIVLEVQSSSFVGDVVVGLSSNIGTILERNADATTNIISGTSTADVSIEIVPGSAIDQGGASEFEVKVFNNGPKDAEKVILSMAITGILDEVVVNSGSGWECQINSLVIDCQYSSILMPVGQYSSIFVTANTTQVVSESEDLVLVATVETDSDDPEISNNTATSSVGVSGTPSEGDIGSALRDVLGGASSNPQINRAIDAVAGYCGLEYFTALEELCDDLYSAALEGDRDAVSRFLKEITPNEVIGQSTSVAEIAAAQFRNIGARLNQLRSGGGSGFSSAGLNARYGNGSIPLGMLAYLNQTEEEANKIDTNNDFISPWGFFVNGTVSMGKRDATGRELGFDFDTFGLTAGLDYRLDAKKVVGIAVGYANFDSKIEGTAKLNSTGVTLTGYGSFYINDNFYVDARISLAKPDFDQSRKIDFTLGETRINRTAIGKTRANQYGISMSAGYSFYKNSWNITPNGSFTYTSTVIDSFSETGAGDFNILYSEQAMESLVWAAGIRVSKAISMKKGVITPQFDFDYNYQGLNDDSLIEARFILAPEDQLFIIETDTPDRSYGSAGVGLIYISANGKQAYFNYRSVLGLEGFSQGTYNIGARFEF